MGHTVAKGRRRDDDGGRGVHGLQRPGVDAHINDSEMAWVGDVGRLGASELENGADGGAENANEDLVKGGILDAVRNGLDERDGVGGRGGARQGTNSEPKRTAVAAQMTYL